jgi:hypothetical protein
VVTLDVGATAVLYERFALCTLGCRRFNCAASWLESEWWYVRKAAQNGGVGGLLSVAEWQDVGAEAPKGWQC